MKCHAVDEKKRPRNEQHKPAVYKKLPHGSPLDNDVMLILIGRLSILSDHHMLSARQTGRTHDLLLAAGRLPALPDHAEFHLDHREARAARAADKRRIRNRRLHALQRAFRLRCPVD